MPAIIPIAVAAGSALVSAGIGAATKGGGGSSGPPVNSMAGAGTGPGAPPPPPVNDMPGSVPLPPQPPGDSPNALDNIPHMAGGGSSLTHFNGHRYGVGGQGAGGYGGPPVGSPGGSTGYGGGYAPGGGNYNQGDPYGGSVNPYTLARNGYQMYQPGASPDLSRYFSGYQAQNANTYQTDQDRQGEQNLLEQLRNQAQGIGPSAAQQQLTDATGQNMANSMGLLAASRNSPGGLAAALASNAAAGQGSAGQAAQIRAQEEMAGRQGVGAELGAMSNQDINLGTTNAQMQNQSRQFNAQDQAALANMLQNQYQYTNTMGQSELDRRNAAIAQGMGVDINTGTNNADYWRNFGVNTGGAVANAAGNYLSQPGTNNNTSGLPGGGGDQGGQGGSGDFSNNYNYNGQQLQGYATGHEVNQPTVALIGEAGPEAVVPIHQDGSPAMDRATDPGVRALLTHPDFLKALRAVTGNPSNMNETRAMAGGGIAGVPAGLAANPAPNTMVLNPTMINALAGVGGVGSPTDGDSVLRAHLASLGAPGGSAAFRAMAGGGIVGTPASLGNNPAPKVMTLTDALIQALAGVGGVGNPTGADDSELKRRLAMLGAPGGSHAGR